MIWLLAALSTPASGADVCALCLWTTIQQGVDTGDAVVNVSPGTYLPFEVPVGFTVDVVATAPGALVVPEGPGVPLAKIAGTATIDGLYLDGDETAQLVKIEPLGALTVVDGTLIRGTATFGGAIEVDGGTLVVIGSDLRDNHADANGGAIAAYAGSTVDLFETRLRDNDAGADGGAISLASSDLVVDRVKIEDNVAVGAGGAVALAASTATLAGTTSRVELSGNDADHGGGVALGAGSSATLSGEVLVFGNDAVADGGGVWLDGAVLTAAGPSVGIVDNTADRGAGLYAGAGSELRLTATTVRDNQAQGVVSNGGGLLAEDADVAELVDCLFADNLAWSFGSGGHVSALGTPLQVVGGEYRGGRAVFGGGIHSANSDVEITWAWVHDNEATGEGGGAYHTLGTAQWVGARLEENLASAGLGGAGIAGVFSSLTVLDTALIGNHAEQLGGGVNLRGGDLTLDGSALVGNTAGIAGGGVGVSLPTGPIVVRDSLLEGSPGGGSTAPAGGLLFSAGDGTQPVTLERVVAAGAHATDAGGGFVVSQASSLVFDTVEVRGASARSGGALLVDQTAEVTITDSAFCDTESAESGGAILLSRSCQAAACQVAHTVFVDTRAGLSGGSVYATETWLELRHATIREANAPAGAALFARSGTADVIASVVDSPSGSVFDAAASVVVVADTNVWGGDASAIAGTATGTTTADPTDFLSSGRRPMPCDEETRLHPDSALAQRPLPTGVVDLGAYGGLESTSPWLVDGDGDGDALRYDCNDLGGTSVDEGGTLGEACNGVDDDCDGLIDELDDLREGAGSASLVDIDGDGFAAPIGAPTCSEPPDPALVDCDETDASRHPGADERCDGVDTDCDGEIDDDPVDGTLIAPDADGDGFGDLDAVRSVCGEVPPDSIVVVGAVVDDCDDNDATIYPGAPDAVDDGIDQDCNGFEATALLYGAGCGCSGRPAGFRWALAGGLWLRRQRSAVGSTP